MPESSAAVRVFAARAERAARRAGDALRGLGIGAYYNPTSALFGGTAPLVIQSLSAAGVAEAFFWYVATGAAIAFLVILTLPETKAAVLR